MNNFQTNYEKWMQMHRKRRTGERLAQMNRRDKHGEHLLLQNVLLPTLGSFAFLHPEYEVNLFGSRPIFMDVAYVNSPLLINFELDGYEHHANRISRDQFAAERRRDILLKLEGWHVLRFAFDDVKENPRQLCQLVSRFMHKYTTEINPENELSLYERELIRVALRSKEGKIKFKEIIHLLEISPNHARLIMKKLVSRNLFAPEHASLKRLHTYCLNLHHPLVHKWVQ